MKIINNKPQLKQIRQRLRNNMPIYERLLWQKIRNNQLGVKFRRQFSVENYVLDFYSHEVKLGIEIDGDSHFMSNKDIMKDKRRDNVLSEKYNIEVLRFTNVEIKEGLEECVEKIMEKVDKNKNTPPNLP